MHPYSEKIAAPKWTTTIRGALVAVLIVSSDCVSFSREARTGMRRVRSWDRGSPKRPLKNGKKYRHFMNEAWMSFVWGQKESIFSIKFRIFNCIFQIVGQKVLAGNLDLASNRNLEPHHNRRRHRWQTDGHAYKFLYFLIFFFYLFFYIFFRSILMRRVKAWRLENLELTGSDCFILDMLSVNMPHHVMDHVSTCSLSTCLTMSWIM